MDDFLFRGSLHELDPDVAALVDLEAVRQARKLIMIPSESTVPVAVREAVGSVFHNIYAEGYPPDHWRWMTEDDILDIDLRLAELRRYGGQRYYQGTELADVIESLARRRTAECFANERVNVDSLYVNVQPLSGAPANSAVYTAFMQPGDTLMGLNLTDGGHLTHGSPVARSGKQYNIVSYAVDSETERLDYEQIRARAVEYQPKVIVAGYTSYPWAPDWEKFREIADESGALLLADISHVAGLVIGGAFPSPVGLADVVMFTTHKTLSGPRGAVLLTHKPAVARKLDRGVFPGEQGGPHMNNVAALAVAMELAKTEQFKTLQQQTVKNAKRLADRLAENGLRIPYGGTDSHMLLVDVGQIRGADGSPLSGDMAARLLDIAGLVCNRNTIPGDTSPFRATGIRLGANWVTQRGFGEAEMDKVADAVAELLHATEPFSYATGFHRGTWRAKVDFETLVRVQQDIYHLASMAGIDYEVPTLTQYYQEADAAAEHFRVVPDDEPENAWHTLEIDGPDAGQFLDVAVTSDVMNLGFGDWQPAWVLNVDGTVLSRAVVERLTEVKYLLHVEQNVDMIAQWLISLSDGYTTISPEDIYAKAPGPVSVSVLPDAVAIHRFEGLELPETLNNGGALVSDKAFFIGCYGSEFDGPQGEALPEFSWQEPEDAPLLTTPLHEWHVQNGARMVPFAGYDMPVWYTSVLEEHLATRQQAGLFDVTHMGVFEFAGSGAERFLDAVTTNDITRLAPGDAHYSYLLGVDGIPIDDIFVYRLATERFMVVVNASNNDKNWTWLNGVKDGAFSIDSERPWATAPGRDILELRDLRAESSGESRRIDVALQGPDSLNILLKLDGSEADKGKLKKLKWAQVTQVSLAGYNLIISRTGYTGERVAFEIFVHPDEAVGLVQVLVDAGAVPCGLAARDSLRTEAGLPLYGHELAGDLNMNPADAGFASFVKLWKPFFIGKAAYLKHEAERTSICTRFRMNHKGGRPPQPGDPILDRRGRVVGTVTSCSIDSEGYQLGQALFKEDYASEGSEVFVFANAARTKQGKTPAELGPGDRTAIPETATVLSRFPKRKK